MYYNFHENIPVFWKRIAAQTGLYMLDTTTHDTYLIPKFILKIICSLN